jgi:hypothetical protein
MRTHIYHTVVASQLIQLTKTEYHSKNGDVNGDDGHIFTGGTILVQSELSNTSSSVESDTVTVPE